MWLAALLALVSLAVVPQPAIAADGGGLDFDAGEGLLGGEELPGDPLGSAPATGLSIADVLDENGGYTYKDGGRVLDVTLLGADGETQGAAALADLPDASETNSTSSSALAFATDTGQRLELGDGVVVVVTTGTSDADARAMLARHGVSAAEITSLGLDGSYHIATESDAASLKLAADLADESLVVSASPNWVSQFEVGTAYNSAAQLRSWCGRFEQQFSDELSGCAWHLDSSTDYREPYARRDPAVDINLTDAWQYAMGQGVAVAVVDDQWNGSHEDLAPNSDLSLSRTWRSGGSGESPSTHATKVAGVIGARDNAVGGRGVAPRAKLLNYPLIEDQTVSRWASTFLLNRSVVGASNHSYSKLPSPSLLRVPYTVWRAMNASISSSSAGGKGSVIVKAAGNENRDSGGRATPHNGRTSLHEFHSHPGVMTVCAVDAYGNVSPYSNQGPNLWLCAPSSGTQGLRIIAPHGNNDYGTIGGTSAAAPQVSGVAALVRSVNPSLTWRDVKLLLADTATKNKPSDASWLAGAARYSDSSQSYSYSPKFGFGLVNADDAVDKAFTWPLLPRMQTATRVGAGGTVPNSVGTLERTLSLSTDIDFVEHIGLRLYMRTADVRDFTITLVAPSGRESAILDHTAECDKVGYICTLYGSFEFASTRHLGEDPSGTWKLRIKNNTAKNVIAKQREGNTGDPPIQLGDQPSGQLQAWVLYVRGHDSSERVSTPKLRMRVGATDAITESVSEGSSLPVTVTVHGAAPTADLVVPVTVTAGTALPGASKDYVAITSVTIPAGSKSATASIAVNRDAVAEQDETFTVGFGAAPRGYHLVGVPTTVTIKNGAPSKPSVSVSAGSGVTEGGSASFTLTASPRPAAALSVQVKITQSGSFAASGQTGTRTVTVPVSGTATFTVSTSDDRVDEPNGSVTATVVSASGYTVGTASGTVAVSDNDVPPLVSVLAGSGVTEGASASFTLSAFPLPSSALSVQVKITQSGSFAASGQTGTRTVTVPVSGTATFTVSTVDDSTDEPDGSITATVMSGSGYGLPPSPSGTVAVSDNDVTQNTTTDKDEGDEGGTAACVAPSDWSRWSWLRKKPTQQTAPQSVRNLAARAVETLEGRDTLTWSAWVAAEPGWGTLDDNDNRHDNRRALRDELNRLETCRDNNNGGGGGGDGGGGDGTTTTTPVVSVIAGSGVTEGAAASFTLTASPAPAADLTVNIAVTQSGDHAASGTTGTKTVTIGTTGTAAYTVATTDDIADEPDGTVTVTVNTGSGYTVSATKSAAAVAVADNDVPAVSITAGSAVTEGASASFTVSASPAPASALTVTIAITQNGDYAVSGTTGTKTVTIPTSGTAAYTVATVDDSADEADGSVTATVKAGSGYTIGTASGTVTVNDNDTPQPDSDPESDPELDPEPDKAAPEKLTLTANPDGTVEVGWPSLAFAGATTAGYKVWAMSFSDRSRRPYDAAGDQNWLTISDLSAGTRYIVWVDAYISVSGWTTTIPRRVPGYAYVTTAG